MLEDMADAVLLLGSGSYNVTRRAVPLMVDGRVLPSSSTALVVTGSLQPSSGRDVQRLPEGLRDRETMVIFTSTELQAANPSTGAPGDRLEVSGRSFEVQTHERWVELGNFHRYVIVLVPA